MCNEVPSLRSLQATNSGSLVLHFSSPPALACVAYAVLAASSRSSASNCWRRFSSSRVAGVTSGSTNGAGCCSLEEGTAATGQDRMAAGRAAGGRRRRW